MFNNDYKNTVETNLRDTVELILDDEQELALVDDEGDLLHLGQMESEIIAKIVKEYLDSKI